MAAELDGIVVKITGDASGLESTIKGVESELSALEKAQGKSNTVTATGTKGLGEYKKQLQETQNTLNTSRAVLNNTKKAYEDNQKSYAKNISTLRQQQTSLEGLITTKNNEIKALEHANTIVNKGSIAYNDNVKAIEWTKTELSSLEQQHKRVTDSIRTQETVLAGSKKAYEDAQSTVALATKQYESYEKGLKAVERAEQSQQLQDTGKKWKETSEGINAATKPLQYTALALMAGGVAASNFAIDFEDSFAAVKKTVDGTPEQLNAIKQSIIDMTTVGINGHNPIPLTTNELTALASAGGQLGIATENIADFTETMAMMGTATNLYGEQGAAVLARFMNVTNTSQDHVSNLGSAIVELGNNFATTEAEIAQMALNMGATGDVVGISAQDVLAYSTALSSLGVEAQAGGSSVARIWMDIQSAVSSGGEDLQKFAKLSGKSSKEFSEQWKKDASGAFQDFLKGLNESDDQIGVLADLGFNNIRDIQALQRLAGDKGLELLTDAIKRSNDAWEENTALQNEFNSKAETTASQIQVVKNNAVEAARGIGETMLPTIKDVSSGIADYARNLAEMNDRDKKNLVSVAGGVIALGVASKGLVAGTKFVGDFAEGIGKIKGTKAFGSIVDTLDAMPTSVKLASGAIIGLGIFGKKAYDMWYESQYHWSEGLAEGNKRISESLSKYKDISSIQNEIKDLKFTIDNPDSSAEQVETAKSRLEEIKELLSREYNLVINSDNSNLDDVVETIKSINQSQLQLNINSQNAKLTGLKDKFDSFDPKEYENAIKEQARLSELMLKVQDIDKRLPGTSTDPEVLKARADALNELGQSYGYTTEEIESNALSISDLSIRYDELDKKLGRLGEQKAAHDEYVSISTELANWNTELLQMSAAASDAEGVANALSNIGMYVNNAGLDMSGYAQAAALAMNGLDNFNGAVEGFVNGDGKDMIALIDDYIRAMDAFGATAEQKQAGLASFATQLTEIAHNANLIPDDKEITITADGKLQIIDKAKEKVEDLPDEHNTNITATDNTADGVKSAKDNLDSIQDKTVTLSVKVNMPDMNSVSYGLDRLTKPKAQGTQNFEGGLAKVNDQKGISDPRELIIDRGRAFIPEGRDVILPLSKGAKVYTAAQTKAIMSGAGIPHYAEGKNNSDAFTKARDNWSHYTKTHAVTTAEELEKWLEFQEKYKKNTKDIWDIEEQVFSLRQKQFNEQTKASEAWITHETKYNGLAVTEQLDAIDRIRKSVVAAYESGLISHQEYLDTIASYDEKYIDKRKEQIAEMYDISKAYISDRTFFNNWGEYGDDPIEAYRRVQNDRLNELRAGELTQKEYDEYMKELGSDMYSERREQSERWLEESRRYFNMNAEDYAKGIERMKKYTQEYYDAGLINLREYNEAMTELNHMAWDEAESAYEEMLSNQSKYISEMRDKFSKQEQELRDSWTVEDRKTDMATVQKQLDLYSGAVTDRGQQKYKELQDQMKQLRRDEELYNLQVANNATIESLEAEYSKLEADKKAVLAGIAQTNIDVSGIIGTLTSNLDGMGGSIINLLQTLINTVDNKELSVTEGPTYNDNRNISLTQMAEILPYIGEMR